MKQQRNELMNVGVKSVPGMHIIHRVWGFVL